MNESLGILETVGLTPTLAALDQMEKSAGVRVAQCELNDLGGVVSKIVGPTAAVTTAIEAGRQTAEAMRGEPIASVIPRPDRRAWEAIQSPPTYNPLIEQDVVFFPQDRPAANAGREVSSMSQQAPFALGIIETQGFTAVFEAIDAACKAANVQVIGKEKLGGGFIAVIVKGDLSAVNAAIQAGQEKVDGLGKLIAAHVIARPSASVLSLLPSEARA